MRYSSRKVLTKDGKDCTDVSIDCSICSQCTLKICVLSCVSTGRLPSVRARTFGVSEEEEEEEEGGLCEYEGGDWRGGWRRSEDEYKVTMLGN